MISRILIPIDFSAGSAAALRYAEAFAAFTGINECRVIHVFTPQAATADTPALLPVGELMDAREEAMHSFLGGIPAPSTVRRRSELVLGFPVDKIVDESGGTDLVVLGATGESDLLESVFGTVASDVVQKANCAVLLVPKGARFDDYRHILYASNSLSMSRRAVLKFMAFNELFRARIHFVHVNDDESEHRREREKLFAPLFNNPNPEFAFEIVEVTAESVQQGLVDYLHQNPIQLAVMVTQRRGFWERLFHHSNTKQMLLHAEVPVLVLQGE